MVVLEQTLAAEQAVQILAGEVAVLPILQVLAVPVGLVSLY
jgi:hypothetical protein